MCAGDITLYRNGKNKGKRRKPGKKQEKRQGKMGSAKKIRVIKRNGEEVAFHLSKIENAIAAANKEVDRLHQMNDYQVKAVAENVTKQIEAMTHAVHVEDIQDMVETGIMEMRGYEVAQKYVRYRYKRELTRKSNTTDNGILALIDNINEEVNQ